MHELIPFVENKIRKNTHGAVLLPWRKIAGWEAIKTVFKIDFKFLCRFFFQLVGFFFKSPCICLEEISLIAIQKFSVFVRFLSLISKDLFFVRNTVTRRLTDKVLGFIQVKCPYHFRQCPFAPDLYHSPIKFILKMFCSEEGYCNYPEDPHYVEVF